MFKPRFSKNLILSSSKNMFANEDFDLDEDFLNDISQKETEYYSQTVSSDEENYVGKRFKNDKESSVSSCSKSISNSQKSKDLVSEKCFLVPKADSIENVKSIRKNLILERLNRHGNNSSDSGVSRQDGKTDTRNLNTEKSQSTEAVAISKSTMNKSRRTLISERFKRNNANSMEENSRQMDSNNIKSAGCKVTGKSMSKPQKPLYHKPVTVVRQFPGPAGLLPELSTGIDAPFIPDSLSFDDNSDRLEVNSVNDSSIISEFCSQNTTNAFSRGAWRSLMTDLSPDFLNGHEISTIRSKVLTNSHKNNKVPFLAGIVQRVDFSFVDPLVVLKDCTGTIEGTVCKDILLEYPHSLDIGAVLFLGNVGLLTIGNHLKKCHVIITLKNVLNVYTDKGQIFDVDEMEVKLRNLNNHKHSPNSKTCNRPNFDRVPTNENTDPQLPQNSLQTKSNLYSKSTVAEILPVVGTSNVNSGTNATSVNKCANVPRDVSKNLNNFETDNSSDKPMFESGDIEDFNDDFGASFFDIDDHFLSSADTDSTKKTSPLLTNAVSVTNPIPNSGPSSTMASEKTEHSVLRRSQPTGKSDSMQNEKVDERESNVIKTSDIKLKLSVFRSNSELTPPDSKELDFAPSKETLKETIDDRVESSSTSGFLFNQVNDSDEELFTQLDVESIVSRYNNKLNDVN